LYEAIVLRARQAHLPGRRCCGARWAYGHSSRLHTTEAAGAVERPELRGWRSSTRRKKIDAFLPELDAMMIESGGSGLVTLERAQVLQYGPRAQVTGGRGLWYV